jgi:hypothetical protein
MNSHSFRMWVKALDRNFFIKYNINPVYFKLICYTLSMYGDYKTGTNIKPSWLTIARESGVDRKTAMKTRDILIKESILVKTSLTNNNITVYKFQDLSKSQDQLSKSHDHLSTQDGHNITKDITKNINYKKKYNNQGNNVSWKEISLSSLDNFGPLAGI